MLFLVFLGGEVKILLGSTPVEIWSEIYLFVKRRLRRKTETERDHLRQLRSEWPEIAVILYLRACNPTMYCSRGSEARVRSEATLILTASAILLQKVSSPGIACIEHWRKGMHDCEWSVWSVLVLLESQLGDPSGLGSEWRLQVRIIEVQQDPTRIRIAL